MNINIFNTLAKGEILDRAFERLNEKVVENPFLLNSLRLGSEINLGWLLSNRHRTISHLRTEIGRKRFFPGPASINAVSLDKNRDLISLSWPDRVVDSAISIALNDAIEPKLSEHVYSFRKGRSNHEAVANAAKWISLNSSEGKTTWVLKLDIAGYDRSIPHKLLLKQLKDLFGEQDPYFIKLLNSYLTPQIVETSKPTEHKPGYGIQTGLCITQVFANLYLRDLDSALGAIPGAFYARFGDDVLFLHSSKEQVLDARIKTLEILALLELLPSERKSSLFQLSSKSPSDISNVDKTPCSIRESSNKLCFDYLGFSLNAIGEIFLSSRRERKLREDLRNIAHLSYSINRRSDLSKEHNFTAIINSLNRSLRGTYQHSYIGDLLWKTTDCSALKRLDTWIAKQVLSQIYRTSHDRVFRYLPFKELRKRGLVSLVHLQNSRGRLV